MSKQVEKYIERKNVTSFFDSLNKKPISYVLIKNIENELPDRLLNGKDIDILVYENDKKAFEKVMLLNGFKKCTHPWGLEKGWSFLYGLPEFQFWVLDDTSQFFYIDVSYLLCCKSLMPKTWIPLDRKIQKNIWKKRVFDEKNQWWIMDVNTRFIYYLVRCIFDKQTFSDKYIHEIENSYSLIDIDVVKEGLNLIFFKYTNRLLMLLEKRKYSMIVEDYVSFSKY